MKKTIEKTRKRYESMKGSPSRDVILRTVLPLISRLDEKLNGHMEIIDANFNDVFATLNIASEANFIELSRDLVTNMATFVDRLMVAAGYFKESETSPGEFEVSDDIPDDVKETLVAVQAQNVEWFNQYQAVLEIEALDDDDDDEDGDDGDDEDGDDGDEPVLQVAPDPEVLPPEVSDGEGKEAANA